MLWQKLQHTMGGQKANSLVNQGGTQLLQMYQAIMTQLNPNSNLWKSIFNAVQKAGGVGQQSGVILKGLEATIGDMMSSKLDGLMSKFDKVLLGIKAAGGDPAAMQQLQQQREKQARQEFRDRAKQGLQGAFDYTTNLMGGSDRVDRVGKELFGGLAKVGDKIPVIGGVIKKVGEFGESLFKGIERLRAWNDRLHENDRRFAEWSASMAQVMSERQMRDILLAQERGERRAPSARYREEASSAFEREMAPMEDAIGNFQNMVAGWLQVQGTNIGRAVNWLLGLNKEELANQPNIGNNPDALHTGIWMENIADRWWMQTYGRPLNMQQFQGPNAG
jgi:hypothetical protein